MIEPHQADSRQPWRADAHDRRRSPSYPPIVALLVALVLVAACTVRLELASPRVAPGDHFPSSAGLAGHERWLASDPDAVEPPPQQGVTLAAVSPGNPERPVVVLLPDVEEASLAPDEPEPRPGPAPPTPAFRPASRVGAIVMPPPPKPLVRVAAGARPDGLPFVPDLSAAHDGPSVLATERVRSLPALALAPELELARPGTGNEVIWLAMSASSPMPAAGPRDVVVQGGWRSLERTQRSLRPVRRLWRYGAPS